jgi:hypothetical protein
MFLSETYHRRNASSAFDSFKLLVWLVAATLPWAAVYGVGHTLFGL